MESQTVRSRRHRIRGAVSPGAPVPGEQIHAVFETSENGVIRTWSSGAQRAFGWTPAEILGTASAALLAVPDQVQAPLRDRAGSEPVPVASEQCYIRKDRTTFFGESSVLPMHEPSGLLSGYTAFVTDTTARRVAREALLAREEHLRLVLESIPDYAICSLALDGLITTWSPAASATFGYSAPEIIGHTFAELFSSDDAADAVPQTLLARALDGAQIDEERWLVRKDGTRFFGAQKIRRLRPGSAGTSRGFVYVVQDVTTSAEQSALLQRKASLDQLTELPNRSTFFEHLCRAIATLKRRSANAFAVLFIDLDRFKEVNDTFGHVVADRLLEVTARRLERCVRSEDVVARIGGDEFAILLNGINGVSDALDAADRIATEMRHPIPIDGRCVHISVSVGIALGDARYERPQEILADADRAMYAAKAEGRGRANVFNAAAANASRSQTDVANDLPYAIERGELRVVYQPLLRLADASIAGFEALVRWQHPRLGLLLPQDFIAKAEESETIVAVDRWVLREACATLARWRSEFYTADLSMNVNFSSREFAQARIVEDLRHVVATNGIPAGRLHIEITESAFLEHSERTKSLLAQIRELGIELHVDDFGVGYSSLAALGHIPLNALKIDRSFLQQIGSPNGAELIRTITQLAHNLGLAATAEGIETDAQLGALIAVGCELGQGYLFSRPLDAAGATKFLRQAVRPGAAVGL